MSMITFAQPTIPAPEPGWIPSRLNRMTVDEYEAMVASGALKSRNRFHRINGDLVAGMTQNPPVRARRASRSTNICPLVLEVG